MSSSITKEEVAQAVREWASTFDSRDYERLWQFECESVGFGYRSTDARPMAGLGRELYLQVHDGFFSTFERYHLEFESLETAVVDGFGLAWGCYIEDFQHKGMAPERARVRFTQTMRKDESGWKILLFHRDIQPFGEDGRYPRSLTAT